jgi:hypothetical protein
VRHNRLAQALDGHRWNGPIHPEPAIQLYRTGKQGARVASRFGVLAHYTSGPGLLWVAETGAIGHPRGTWLTPTPYAGCMVPYDLGLENPRDVCILVDVRELGDLWGPGTCRRSANFGAIWQGGGIEFYYPGPIPLRHVRRIILSLSPCGDLR